MKKLIKNEFPIIGIGASAGGMEALERFFSNTPADGAAAYVVVMHLLPGKKSNLPKILQKFTGLKVVAARHGARIRPGCIYVSPAGKQVSVRGGVISAVAVERRPAAPTFINTFLVSLAEERGRFAAGVILSGTGMDGSDGIIAVHGAGGTTCAQEPSSAQFGEMPSHAIETGCVDLVGSASDIPAMLLKAFAEKSLVPRDDTEPGEIQTREYYDRILSLVSEKTGRDFSLYKYNTIYRRIEHRMAERNIADMKQYVEFLAVQPEEIDFLYHDFLIKVTSFFRDREAFKIVERTVVPSICESRKDGDTVRVWCAGCGTGEEAYSIAMIFKHYIEKTGRNLSLMVFASDMDDGAIAAARKGEYPASAAADVEKKYARKYLLASGKTCTVAKELREHVVFTVHDITRDPVFSRIDLVLCRNLLIYLRQELQRKIIPLFHYALNPGGFLVIGSAEGVGQFTRLFSVVDKRWKIYRKSLSEPQVKTRDLRSALFPPAFPPAAPGQAVSPTMNDIEAAAGRIVLSRHAPPYVIIDGNSRIIYFSGSTDRYLSHVPGKADLNIVQMASGKLKSEIRMAIAKAMKNRTRVTAMDIAVKRGRSIEKVTLVVEPIGAGVNGQGEDYYVVVFREDRPAHLETGHGTAEAALHEGMKDQIIIQLENELINTKDQLQKMLTDYDLSGEELKASNEEILSMNEELQSANEELQTSKEELLMLNDEMSNKNIELHEKVIELTRARNDIRNLLSSTEIAALFIDNDLCLKNFTPAMTEIFNFLEKDIGRSVEHFSNKLRYDDFISDARSVLKTLNSIEKEVSSGDGSWHLVRILPYRTDTNAIDGLVITFTEISRIKRIQAMVKESEHRLRMIFNNTIQSFILIDSRGMISSVNRISRVMTPDIFGREMSEGDFITQFDFRDGTTPDLITLYKGSLNGVDGMVEIDGGPRDGQQAHYIVRFAPTYDDSGEATGVLLRITDDTERKKFEKDIILAKDAAELASRVKSQFLSNMSHEVRTPLTGILGMAEILDRMDLPEEQRRYVRNIIVSGRLLQGLVNNILDLSMIESGRRVLRLEIFEPRVLLRDLVASFSELVATKGIALRHRVEDGVPRYLVGDVLAIQQVLINLLNNAFKFTEHGEIAVSVDAQEGDAHPVMVEFSVADSGIGIQPEHIDGIFERFTQIDPSYSKKFAGAGLGLSIVKSLVDLMRGTLTVESTPDMGSLFRVILPLDRGRRDEVPAIAAFTEDFTSLFDRKLNALVVEDNAINQMALKYLLEKNAFSAESAFNGKVALEMVTRSDFDIVLMDIQMPVMDGIACTRAIREMTDEKKRTLPIIALTGYAMEQDRARIMKEGFDDYAIKPVNENDILSKIYNLLKSRA